MQLRTIDDRAGLERAVGYQLADQAVTDLGFNDRIGLADLAHHGDDHNRGNTRPGDDEATPMALPERRLRVDRREQFVERG